MKRITITYTFLSIFAVFIASCSPLPTQNNDYEILSSFENAVAEIVDQSKPAIVSISVIKDTEKNDHPHGSHGSGSGFFIRKDGYILTNEHVVNGAKSIKVSLFDSSRYDARMVGSDPNTDIAVLKIEGSEEFPVLIIEDSVDVRVGQYAIAIGDPIGFRYTVTAGIIGGKGRCFHPKNDLFQYHHNYIQTDAWINPGSSGGPLLNIQGNVIGINTLNPGEGSTLAINSGLAKTIGNQLIAQGRIIRGYIDADMHNVSQGIKITGIKRNSSSSRDGLKRNDIIVEFNEEKIPTLNEFRMVVAEYQIGKQCSLKVLRGEQEITLNITVDEMPLELVGRAVKTGSVPWKNLGLAVRNLENGIYERYTYLSGGDRGIIVEKVKRYSPGFYAKIPRNALIVAINGQEIVDVQTLETFLQVNQGISNVTLDIKSVHGSEIVRLKLNDSEGETGS